MERRKRFNERSILADVRLALRHRERNAGHCTRFFGRNWQTVNRLVEGVVVAGVVFEAERKVIIVSNRPSKQHQCYQAEQATFPRSVTKSNDGDIC